MLAGKEETLSERLSVVEDLAEAILKAGGKPHRRSSLTKMERCHEGGFLPAVNAARLMDFWSFVQLPSTTIKNKHHRCI